jgi:hypothetical protein
MDQTLLHIFAPPAITKFGFQIQPDVFEFFRRKKIISRKGAKTPRSEVYLKGFYRTKIYNFASWRLGERQTSGPVGGAALGRGGLAIRDCLR